MILREFQERYKAGEFSTPDINRQMDAGWSDWFCPDTSLPKRLKKMWKIISRITNDDLLDNYIITFHNNCPCAGPLYDDFMLHPTDKEKWDELSLTVVIDDKRLDHKYELFSAKDGYRTGTGFADAREVAEFLNNPQAA